jgi:hypothetical protein
MRSRIGGIEDAMRINAVLIGALAALATGCSSPVDQNASKGDQNLKADVQHAGFYVTIKNDDSQDWDNVRAALNDDYHCPATHISAGATERIRMTSCVADGGKTYDPLTIELRTTSVTAVLARDKVERSNSSTF